MVDCCSGLKADERLTTGVFSSAAELDFEGDFLYALNCGAGAGGQRIGDATFTQARFGEGTPGVTLASFWSGFPVENALGTIGLRPQFGETADDAGLEEVLWSITFGGKGTIKLEGLEVGKVYRLQLLWSDAFPRRMEHLISNQSCGFPPDDHADSASALLRPPCRVLLDDGLQPGAYAEPGVYWSPDQLSLYTPRHGSFLTYEFEAEYTDLVLEQRMVQRSSERPFGGGMASWSSLTLENLGKIDAILIKRPPCGGGTAGDGCGRNSEISISCQGANAVFSNGEWLCSDVDCNSTHARRADAADVSVFGVDEQQEREETCCIPMPQCAAGEFVDVDRGCQTCPAGRSSIAGPDSLCLPDIDGSLEAMHGSSCVCVDDPVGIIARGPAGSCINLMRMIRNNCDFDLSRFGLASPRMLCPVSCGECALIIDSTECYTCAPGTSAPAGSAVCSACAAGTFSAEASNSSCQNCPAGKFTDTGASITCAGVCAAGTHSSGGLSADCMACAAGQYDHDSLSETPCLQCPVGTFSGSNGSIACDLCAASATRGAQACPPDSTYLQTQCSFEMSACAANNCTDEVNAVLASPDSGRHMMSRAALAVVNCVRLSIQTGSTPRTGCTDPAAANYDTAAVLDDDSCRYLCPADGLCFIYNAAADVWQPTAPNIADNGTRHVLVQGHTLPRSNNDRQCRWDYFDAEPAPWQQADRACTAAGGRLATIRSDEDYAVIKALIPPQQPVWIGLNDRSAEKRCDGTSFVWTDGTSAYQQWLPGEPDSYGCRVISPMVGGGNTSHITSVCESACTDDENTCIPIESSEDCVQMSWLADSNTLEPSWADKSCEQRNPYICGYRCLADVGSRSSTRMELRGALATLRMLYFDGQIAYGAGGTELGASLAFFDSRTVVEHVQIKNSEQRGAGAALYVEGGRADIRFSLMEKNLLRSAGSAGLYACRGADVTMSHSRIEANEVLQSTDSSDPASIATAIMLDTASLDCLYSRIAFNTGAGSIVTRNSTLSITNSVIKNNEGGTGGTALTLLETTATMSSVVFTANSGSTGALAMVQSKMTMNAMIFRANRGYSATASGGAMYFGPGSTITGNHCVIELNSAFGAVSAGAILCDRSQVQLTDSTLAKNRIEPPNNVAGRRQLQGVAVIALTGAGGIHAVGSSISMLATNITDNVAVDQAGELSSRFSLYCTPLVDANVEVVFVKLCPSCYAKSYTRSLHLRGVRWPLLSLPDRVCPCQGELLGGAFSNGLYTRKVAGSLFKVNVKDSVFLPFLEGDTVTLSPRIIGSVVTGGCQENPCSPGNKCIYSNYSLSCQRCSAVTYSADGVTCVACPESTGPNADLTACAACEGSNYSSFGVCLLCDSTLVATEDKRACRDCGIHQTALAVLSDRRTCACEAGFTNGSQRMAVCFFGGYEEDRYMYSVEKNRASLQQTGQECEACPVDISGDTCLECTGQSGSRISPGFMTPVLESTPPGSSRPMQWRGQEVLLVFRCHIEKDLAIARCPQLCAEPPCQCAEGYRGTLCGTCAEGFGMNSGTRQCDLCEGAGYNWTSMFVLLGSFLSTLLVACLAAKVWKSFPMKHLLRCSFQPIRILITYSQITSQLGNTKTPHKSNTKCFRLIYGFFQGTCWISHVSQSGQLLFVDQISR